MNWKSAILWLLVFIGLAYFFFSFASYLFDRQEEMQLFMPLWEVIKEHLLTPGGLSEILGLTCTQYYCIPLLAALLNAALLCAIGICFYLLLQKIEARGYNLIFALFPVVGLMKMHIELNYVADGTIAILFMMLLLCVWMYVSKPRIQIIYVIISTIVLYWIASQIVILYSLLLIVLSSFFKKGATYQSLLSVVISTILLYIDVRYLLNIPLSKGFYSLAYHNSQIQTDSLVYYTWIRFSILLFFLFIVCKCMCYIRWEGIRKKILVSAGITIIFFLYMSYFLPNVYDVQNRMIDQLSYMLRRKQWDAIIRIHTGKKLPGAINRSSLNMALAQKGTLGDKLYSFDQHGPSGLLPPYNGTYYMSILLSDIHFYIGDISTSESYAMEALTLARRKGSPRALQRLIQINLIKEEWDIVAKYLSLLDKMPCYKSWAGQYRSYLFNPKKIQENKELSGKQKINPSYDTLLSLMTIDRLWTMHIEDPVCQNRTAMEYLGCSYLLAKEMDAFKSFFFEIAEKPKWQPLPVHFQEAATMLNINSQAISPEIRQRYEDYRKAVMEAKRTSKTTGLQQYANTFWFYYQFKESDKKRTNSINTPSIYD